MARKVIQERESIRGSRLIISRIDTPVQEWAGRGGEDDRLYHRWFKIIDRDALLEDLYQATGRDLRAVDGVYPTFDDNGPRIDLDYIQNLEALSPVYGTGRNDEVIINEPGVFEGPHITILTEDSNTLRAIDSFFMAGILRTDRQTVDKTRLR